MRYQSLFEALWIFAVLLVLAIIAFLIKPWLALIVLLFIGYTFAFFRDPERVAPNDPAPVVPAADGRVADRGRRPAPEAVAA